jgi:hypothetical protein
MRKHRSGAEPRFVYANKTAQRCFEYDWNEFVGLPSRLTAGPQDRSERQELLDAVDLKGFVEGYRGCASRSPWAFLDRRREDVEPFGRNGRSDRAGAIFQRWPDA